MLLLNNQLQLHKSNLEKIQGKQKNVMMIWILDTSTWSRKGPLKYQNILIGGGINKMVRRVKNDLNKKLVKQRQVKAIHPNYISFSNLFLLWSTFNASAKKVLKWEI